MRAYLSLISRSISFIVEHHITIRTAGNPIVAEGYGTVGRLQNCLLVTALQKNLISVSHVCRDLNAFFVTDTTRCVCFEKGTNKILHECNMADGLYSTYDLEWLGINILDAAPDLTVMLTLRVLRMKSWSTRWHWYRSHARRDQIRRNRICYMRCT